MAVKPPFATRPPPGAKQPARQLGDRRASSVREREKPHGCRILRRVRLRAPQTSSGSHQPGRCNASGQPPRVHQGHYPNSTVPNRIPQERQRDRHHEIACRRATERAYPTPRCPLVLPRCPWCRCRLPRTARRRCYGEMSLAWTGCHDGRCCIEADLLPAVVRERPAACRQRAVHVPAASLGPVSYVLLDRPPRARDDSLSRFTTWGCPMELWWGCRGRRATRPGWPLLRRYSRPGSS